MRVIIYGRVNRLGLSADSQMEKLRNYCREKGYEVVREVKDCCSGSDVGTNLVKLLNEQEKDYEAIVIRDLSRISRDLVKMLEMIKKMRSRCIRLIALDGTEDDSVSRDKPFLKKLKVS